MINLIPDTIKLNNRYAIKNSRLLRYTIWGALTMLAITLITAIGLIKMVATDHNLKTTLDQQNAKLDSLRAVEANGEKLYDQITTINELLNRQLKYSDLLPQLAKVLPPGAILKQLEFNASDVTGESSTATTPAPTNGASSTLVAKLPDKPFVIHAAVTNPDVATTLLENICAQNNLFTSADLLELAYSKPSSSSSSTNTSDPTGTSTPSASTLASKYPYQVTINAYFKKKKNSSSSGVKSSCTSNAKAKTS